MIAAPLLLRLQNFEERHDSIMTYAFTVFVSIQKQFYCELANGMAIYPNVVSQEQSPALPFILNNGSTTDIDEVKAAIARQNEQEKAAAAAAAAQKGAASQKGASTDTPYACNQQQGYQPYQQGYQPYQQGYQQGYQQPAGYQQPTGYTTPDQQQQYYQNMYYQQQPQTQNIYAQPDQMQSVTPVPIMEQPQPLPQAPQVPEISQGSQFSTVYSQPPVMEQPQMQPLPQTPIMSQPAPAEEVAE